MVSVAQEKIYLVISLLTLLYCLSLIGNWSQINLKFIPQSVIKSVMKLKLRMEGAVNGHNFVIIGEGDGKPYE